MKAARKQTHLKIEEVERRDRPHMCASSDGFTPVRPDRLSSCRQLCDSFRKDENIMISYFEVSFNCTRCLGPLLERLTGSP